MFQFVRIPCSTTKYACQKVLHVSAPHKKCAASVAQYWSERFVCRPPHLSCRGFVMSVFCCGSPSDILPSLLNLFWCSCFSHWFYFLANTLPLRSFLSHEDVFDILLSASSTNISISIHFLCAPFCIGSQLHMLNKAGITETPPAQIICRTINFAIIVWDLSTSGL